MWGRVGVGGEGEWFFDSVELVGFMGWAPITFRAKEFRPLSVMGRLHIEALGGILVLWVGGAGATVFLGRASTHRSKAHSENVAWAQAS